MFLKAILLLTPFRFYNNEKYTNVTDLRSRGLFPICFGVDNVGDSSICGCDSLRLPNEGGIGEATKNKN